MKLKNLAAAFAIGFAFAGSAQALPSATTAWVAGTNVLSDDFFEFLIEPGGSNGVIDVGDILFAAVGITSYLPSGVPASSVKELTILSAIEVATKSTALPDVTCFGATLPLGDCNTFTFKAPTITLAGILGSLGVSLVNADLLALAASPHLTTDSVAVVLEDDPHNFTMGSVPTAADGVLRMVLELDSSTGSDDLWSAIGPDTLADFASNPQGQGIGGFGFNLTNVWESFSWDVGPNVTGQGNLSRTAVGAGGDLSVTIFAIPEPGTTALIGLGLLGMGYLQRRKITGGSK